MGEHLDGEVNFCQNIAHLPATEINYSHLAANLAKELLGIGKKTTLVINCQNNFFIEKLREYGLNAYGTSTYNDIEPYIYKFSLFDENVPEALQIKFDCAVCIEALEDIHDDNIEQALNKLCSFSDNIFFHPANPLNTGGQRLNVRTPEYWGKKFAQQGFYRYGEFNSTCVLEGSVYFSNRDIALPSLVEEYERFIAELFRQRPDKKREYTFKLYFTSIANNDKPFVINTDNIDFEARILLPIGTKKIEFIPTDGKCCIMEDFFSTLNGRPAPIMDVHKKETERIFLYLNPGQALTINASSASPSEESILHLKGRIHVLDKEEDGYLLYAFEKFHKQSSYKSLYSIAENDEILITERLESTVKCLDEELSKHVKLVDELNDLNYYLDKELTESRDGYNNLIHSTSWKVTKPLRVFMQLFKKIVRFFFTKVPGINNMYRYLAAVRNMGRHNVAFNKKHYGTLEGNKAPGAPTQAKLEEQESHRFATQTLISVVVPLYNTPEKYLREMIQSLLGQSYPYWELCLADGSDANHDYVGKIVNNYIKKDKRIKYKKLENNGGIADNSNAALEMATGTYIGLLDHDDVLGLNALFEVYCAVMEKNADFIYSDEATFANNDISNVVIWNFKPDYSPDMMRTVNYICHFTCFKASLIKETGGFRRDFDGSQDYDLFLRLLEKAKQIVHIPKILYYWRSHPDSVAENIDAKPYAITSAIKAIEEHLQRVGMPGTVEVSTGTQSHYRISYELKAQPLVSIIIPNKDEVNTLKVCINSILEKTTYSNYEIIICENNSETSAIFDYYNELEKNSRIKIINWENSFNYSAINNFAVSHSNGEHIILLNNDTEIITPEWIEEMLMFSQREDVGAVGAKLFFPDNTLQHGGVIMGMGGVAAHYLAGISKDDPIYIVNMLHARNVTVVTGACLMMKRKIFDEINGLNPDFAVAFNDVDLCMRIRKAGYLIVFTPHAELYHYESKSRGSDSDMLNMGRFSNEIATFKKLWKKELEKGDPYYNPNFSLDNTYYTIDIKEP